MGSGDQTKEQWVISLVSIKVKEDTIKNQTKRIAIEAWISQCGTNTKLKTDGDVLTI